MIKEKYNHSLNGTVVWSKAYDYAGQVAPDYPHKHSVRWSWWLEWWERKILLAGW